MAEAFFPGKDFNNCPGKEVGKNMLIPPIVFSALILLLGMLPGGIRQWLSTLAGSLV